MIGRISPLVQGERRRNRLLIWHLAGGVFGGFLGGLFAGYLGMLLWAAHRGSWDEVVLFILSGALLVGALRDAGLIRLPIRLARRQTPGYLPCALGESAGVFAWGSDLGFGLTTRPPFLTALVLPLFAVASGDLLTATTVMTTFGIARSGGVVIVVAARASRFPEACTWIAEKKPRFGYVTSATSIAVSVLLIWRMGGEIV